LLNATVLHHHGPPRGGAAALVRELRGENFSLFLSEYFNESRVEIIAEKDQNYFRSNLLVGAPLGYFQYLP
jgi:hypothetical protein